jgi:4-hydroxymandelate oxidase
LINLFDYEREAERRIPPSHWGYIAGGANDEVTLGANRAAFERILIRYRTMVDVTTRDLRTTVLGVPVSMPVLVAPMAMQKLAHAEGECATARAARNAGTLMITSTTATTRLSEVIEASPGPMWFQLYLYQDRGKTRALIEEAVRSGYTGVVLTVDAPVLGRRERDIRLGFTLPRHLTLENAAVAGMGVVPDANEEASGLMLHFRSLHDPALTPRDVEWVREVSGLPVIVKGIVRGDDAMRAVEHGAGGIVVSNHGGRQLDTAIPAITALPGLWTRGGAGGSLRGRWHPSRDGCPEGVGVRCACRHGRPPGAVGPGRWGRRRRQRRAGTAATGSRPGDGVGRRS